MQLMPIAILLFAMSINIGCAVDACKTSRTETLPMSPDRSQIISGYVELASGFEEMAAMSVPALAEIAFDPKEEAEKRREAIFAIGRSASPEGLALLMDNFGLHIPRGVYIFEDDHFKALPCAYALWSGDWRHARVVLNNLNKRPLLKYERSYVATVLRKLLGNRRALVILQSDLEAANSEIHQENIMAVQVYLMPPPE